MYHHAKRGRGAGCYLAPEVLRPDNTYLTTSGDMWSLGALLTYIANDREHLFRDERDVFNWRGVKSPTKRTFKYPELHVLVLKLLSTVMNARPSASEVLRDQKNHYERCQRN